MYGYVSAIITGVAGADRWHISFPSTRVDWYSPVGGRKTCNTYIAARCCSWKAPCGGQHGVDGQITAPLDEARAILRRANATPLVYWNGWPCRDGVTSRIPSPPSGPCLHGSSGPNHRWLLHTAEQLLHGREDGINIGSFQFLRRLKRHCWSQNSDFLLAQRRNRSRGDLAQENWITEWLEIGTAALPRSGFRWSAVEFFFWHCNPLFIHKIKTSYKLSLSRRKARILYTNTRIYGA
jgi:hypothetical protein